MTASLQLTGRHVRYSVRKSLKARRGRIRVSARGIEVVLPRRVPLYEARGLLLKHGAWVEEQLAKLERLDAQRRDHQRAHPDTIMLRGMPTRITVVEDPSARRCGDVEHSDDGIRVRVLEPGAAHANRALELWLRRIARREIESRLAERAAAMNCSFRRVTIRSQRARWGSCSSLKTLSFNWRLIHAPAEVLDYVVVHELAHLIELNHSPRFWQIVRTHCPEFPARKKWLREHEEILDVHRPLVDEAMRSAMGDEYFQRDPMECAHFGFKSGRAYRPQEK